MAGKPKTEAKFVEETGMTRNRVEAEEVPGMPMPATGYNKRIEVLEKNEKKRTVEQQTTDTPNEKRFVQGSTQKKREKKGG